MESSEKLRTGLVGCGSQGSALAHAIVRSSALELAACADPDERRQAAQQPWRRT